MMTFVNMDSDGLVILPTHRVVHSLAGFDPADLRARRRGILRRRDAARGDAAAYHRDAAARSKARPLSP